MTPYSITYSLSEVKCVESTQFQLIRQKMIIIQSFTYTYFLSSKGVQFVCTASILNSLIIDIQERSKTRNKHNL